MKRRELSDLYAPVSPTQYKDAMIGYNGQGEFVHLFRDDVGDWDRSGMPFPSKIEALATLPLAYANYHGEDVETPMASNVAMLGGTVVRLSYLDGHLQVEIIGHPEDESIAITVNGRRYQRSKA